MTFFVENYSMVSFFCVKEIIAPIRNRITTARFKKLKVTSVIPTRTVATNIKIPAGIGIFLASMPNTKPRILPISPIIINVLPAALVTSVVAPSERLVSPAAQAPEQIEPGIPSTPPMIPKIIGAFEVPLTFAIKYLQNKFFNKKAPQFLILPAVSI